MAFFKAIANTSTGFYVFIFQILIQVNHITQRLVKTFSINTVK